MNGFCIWMLTESGRLDVDGLNGLFRGQLEDLLPRVADPRRRAGLEAMRSTDWVAYILAALRNAGWADRREREEAAADLVVHLLVSPGGLFHGYDPDGSGPMPARFALAVQNYIRNLRRSRARRERRLPTVAADAAVGVPDREPVERDHDLLAAFRDHLRRQVGRDAVELLDLRFDGASYRAIAARTKFARLGRAGVRRLAGAIRAEAEAFARLTRDDELVGRIERLTEVFVVLPVRPPEFARPSPRPGTPAPPADFFRFPSVSPPPARRRSSPRLRPAWWQSRS